MKGFIGLTVAQAQAFLDADLPFAVHLAFSYDEEVGCFGVRHLIADLPRTGRPKAAPTAVHRRRTDRRWCPRIAHKGVHRWRCCVKGRAAHSSQTPRRGQRHRGSRARGGRAGRHGRPTCAPTARAMRASRCRAPPRRWA
jgi:acetylornithine deacetylase/succinyl-diaminopimelate desuccinylase-like protein